MHFSNSSAVSARLIDRVGIVGVGAMGLAMARNLHRRRYTVAVRDVRSDAEAAAFAEGMLVCASPAAMTQMVDVIAIVVVNAQQIEDVLFGPDGIVHGIARGKTVLLCSTIAPQDSMRFAAGLEPHGVLLVDAPISGGPARAQSGKMSMMLAGSRDVLEPIKEVLADLAEKRFHIGDAIGDAAKAKLVNNLLAGVNLVAGAEALALAIKLGLDPRKMFDVIAASSGASWAFQDRMARALDDDFAPRAAAHILTKDIGLATALADSVDQDTPLGDAALAKFRETVARGWAELDDAAVLKSYQT